MKRKAYWTRLEGDTCVCDRCGGAHKVNLPIDATSFLKVIRGFLGLHGECKPYFAYLFPTELLGLIDDDVAIVGRAEPTLPGDKSICTPRTRSQRNRYRLKVRSGRCWWCDEMAEEGTSCCRAHQGRENTRMRRSL